MADLKQTHSGEEGPTCPPLSRGPLRRAADELAELRAQLQQEIHNRLSAEARAEELLSQLAHLGRLEMAEELAGTIAHELNQPLSVIVMRAEASAQRLRLGCDESTQQRAKDLDEIAEAAYRAGQIIRRMRSFVKGGDPQRSTVEMAEIVDEVVALVGSDLRHAGIRLDWDASAELPKTLADTIQMQQVLLNLVRNAIEAMHEAGSGAHTLSLGVAARDGMLEVTVCDSGCGIEDGNAEGLFATYTSTKPGGLGMGLTISRSIVEAHGGRIWARRNSGRGTTFTFTLPIVGEERKKPAR